MGYFDRFNKGKYKGKTAFQKFWYFIWKEDSVESWVVNIVLAFVIIKYMIYPGLGFVLGTSHPIVAVVSSSMHHGESFDDYWINGGNWYDEKGISKDEFRDFPMHNGFNKGDIMVLFRADGNKVEIGDIIVFQTGRPDPIIHRIVDKTRINGIYSFQTKGDNYITNPSSIKTSTLNELDIRESQIIGKAFIRVPYLGYVKIFAVDFVCLFNNFNFCINK